jgi:hypothetical protein
MLSVPCNYHLTQLSLEPCTSIFVDLTGNIGEHVSLTNLSTDDELISIYEHVKNMLKFGALVSCHVPEKYPLCTKSGLTWTGMYSGLNILIK